MLRSKSRAKSELRGRFFSGLLRVPPTPLPREACFFERRRVDCSDMEGRWRLPGPWRLWRGAFLLFFQSSRLWRSRAAASIWRAASIMSPACIAVRRWAITGHGFLALSSTPLGGMAACLCSEGGAVACIAARRRTAQTAAARSGGSVEVNTKQVRGGAGGAITPPALSHLQELAVGKTLARRRMARARKGRGGDG